MKLTSDTVFDYKTHRENFIRYCEVIIYKDGKIEYAVPSHQQKLINIYCKKYNISKEELYDIIPIYESPLNWVCCNEGIISVWYDQIVKPTNITKEQKWSLARLVLNDCINPNYKTYIARIDNRKVD